MTRTAGDVQAQLDSGLSLDEMIKVADSLRAAADFHGELDPPCRSFAPKRRPG